MSVSYKLIDESQKTLVSHFSELIDMEISKKEKVEEIYISNNGRIYKNYYYKSENKPEYVFDMDSWVLDFDIGEFINLKAFAIITDSRTHRIRVKSMDKCVLLQFVYLIDCQILEFDLNKLKDLIRMEVENGYIHIHHKDAYFDDFGVIQNLGNVKKLSFKNCIINTDNECISLRNLPSLNDCIFSNCQLLNFYIENCPKMVKLDVKHNILECLDVSSISHTLQYLDCSFNNLTHLDVSKSQLLITLKCNNNELEFLNINKCWCLLDVDCQRNKIEKLPILPISTIKLKYLKDKKNIEINSKTFNFNYNYIRRIPHFLKKEKNINIIY